MSDYEEGFEEWCNNNAMDIEEQYALWLEDEINPEDYYQLYFLNHFKYEDIPYEFKRDLFLRYIDSMIEP